MTHARAALGGAALALVLAGGILAGSALAGGASPAAKPAAGNARTFTAACHCKRGPRGPRGPQGPQGLQGAQGPPGTFNASNLVEVSGPTVFMCGYNGGDCSVQGSQAQCPAGAVPTGGGWDWDSQNDQTPPFLTQVALNRRIGTTWSVIMANLTSSTTQTFRAYAICARSTSSAKASGSTSIRPMLERLRREVAAR